MEDDDKPIGRVLGRREVLTLVGAMGLGALTNKLAGQTDAFSTRVAGAPALRPIPNCVVRPQQTLGPYFVDTQLDRTDIRSEPGSSDKVPGVPLALEFRVSQIAAQGCLPLAGAMVDLWQCDALGVYSGVRDTNGLFDTTGKKFLRGHQITDAAGLARFITIFPGWYEGRAVHLHFKIRAKDAAGATRDFSSQLYFDDALTAEVLAKAPYASKGSDKWVRNERDGIYRRGGRELMVAAQPSGAGYAGTFDIGMQL